MTRRLLLLFVLLLPAMLAATLPLGLALETAGARKWGLSARHAGGNIWNGRLLDASIRGLALGNAQAGLLPLRLLAGDRAVWISTPGLQAQVVAGRRWGVQDLHGHFSLPTHALASALPVQVQADGLQVLFADDACHAASGRVVLSSDAAAGAPMLVLEGSPACEGRAAVLPLAAVAGEGPLARMQASLRVHADGQWELEARIPVVEHPSARIALEAAGFLPGPGGWSRVERGRMD